MFNWINFGIEALAIILSVGALLLVFVLLNKLASVAEKKRKEMYVCPRCGSANIIHNKKSLNDTYFVASLQSNNFFTCMDCEFEGEFPLILKSDLKSFKKSLKNKDSKKRIPIKKV